MSDPVLASQQQDSLICGSDASREREKNPRPNLDLRTAVSDPKKKGCVVHGLGDAHAAFGLLNRSRNGVDSPALVQVIAVFLPEKAFFSMVMKFQKKRVTPLKCHDPEPQFPVKR